MMLFVGHVSILLALIAGLVSFASCAALPETNAQRLARGLPPSPPRFGHNLPGRLAARDPTPVRVARHSKPSPRPPQQFLGRIQARNPEDGSVLGFVRNTNGTSPISGLNFLGPEQDLIVSFTAPSSGAGPFDILAINAAFPKPLFVGASANPNKSGSIGPKSRDTVAFTNVEQTPPNSPPVKSTFDDSLVESAIWSFNPGSKQLKAQYVNPDGSTPTTIVAYDIRANVLFFVGDIDAYNKDNNLPASAVKLYLAPI